MKTSFLFLLPILSACSGMQPEAVDLALNPKVIHATVNIGNGAPVQLSVLDQRSSTTLGKGTWRPPTGGRGLFPDEVYVTKQDVGAIMQGIIQDGLSKLGFTAKASVTREVPTRLSIEVQSIEILNLTGHAIVALRAIVYRKGVKTFERTYTANVPGIPRAFSEVEEPMNLAFADVLQQLLGDLEMLGALVSSQEDHITGDDTIQ